MPLAYLQLLGFAKELPKLKLVTRGKRETCRGWTPGGLSGKTPHELILIQTTIDEMVVDEVGSLERLSISLVVANSV